MGQVEVYPDQIIQEFGSRTLGGGAASTLAALNDASDTTYIQAAGTMTTGWRIYCRYPIPSIPAGAAIRYVQHRIRYSHATRSSTTYEYFQPVTVLVGRPKGTTSAVFDAYAPGERLVPALGTSVKQVTFPARPKDYSGKYFLGERAQMLSGRYWWASAQITRKTAVNTARLYSLSLVVTYDERPTINLLNPSGVEVVGRPPWDWEYNDAEGIAQQVVRLRVFTDAQVAHPLFTPDPWSAFAIKFKPVYDRSIHTGQKHHDMVSALPNGFSGRAYLLVKHFDVWQPGVVYRIPGSTDLFSPNSLWDFAAFSISIATPLSPDVVATYDPTIHGIVISVEGLDNLLPWDVSSIEPTAVPNFATSSTTLTRVTSQFLHGSASLSMQRTGTTGDASATYPFIGTDVEEVGIECEPGALYTGRASFKTAATARTCQVSIEFFDDDGTDLNATNTLYTITDATTDWREAFATATAPATAKWVQISVRAIGCAVSEVHFVDQLGIYKGRRTSLLTENQASLETDTTGWAAGTATTIARNAGIGQRGVAALQINKITATGTALAQTPSGTSGFRVKGSTAYAAAAWFTPFTNARSVRLTIDWFDAAGAATGSQTVGSSIAEVGPFGVWTRATVTGTSPSGAVFARLNLEVLSAPNGEVHFADTIGFWVGSTVGDDRDVHYWNQGGWVDEDPTNHIMELRRSVGVDEEGDAIWETIPEPRITHLPQFQKLSYVDYEVPGGVQATYQAQIEAENGEGNMVSSGWSTPPDFVTPPVPTSWWLRDPLDPDMSMPIRAGSAKLMPAKPNTKDYPIGATAAVMTHDGVKADDVDMLVDLLDEDAYAMFRMLTGSGATLLLQDTFGRQWYVQPDTIEYEVMRAAKQPSEVWPTRHFHRVRITFVSVEKPRALGVASHA